MIILKNIILISNNIVDHEVKMHFYFAVLGSMFEKQGMTTKVSSANTFFWNLNSSTILNNILADSPGKILDSLNEYRSSYKATENSVAICKATADDSKLIDMVRCALTGDSMSTFLVEVSDIIWVNITLSS